MKRKAERDSINSSFLSKIVFYYVVQRRCPYIVVVYTFLCYYAFIKINIISFKSLYVFSSMKFNAILNLNHLRPNCKAKRNDEYQSSKY